MKTKNQNKMEWTYLFVGLSLVLLISCLFSSCTVVKTNFSSKAKNVRLFITTYPKVLSKSGATAKVAVSV
jgi:membrane-anchored protein YejM (alkaline phosphatase superfamily)